MISICATNIFLQPPVQVFTPMYLYLKNKYWEIEADKQKQNMKWIENISPPSHMDGNMTGYSIKTVKTGIAFQYPPHFFRTERTSSIKSMNRCWPFPASDGHSCLFSLDYILRTLAEGKKCIKKGFFSSLFLNKHRKGYWNVQLKYHEYVTS